MGGGLTVGLGVIVGASVDGTGILVLNGTDVPDVDSSLLHYKEQNVSCKKQLRNS